MFRVTRVVFPKGSSYNLPLLSQWSQPKQLIVEFSIIPDNKETLQGKGRPQPKNPVSIGTLKTGLRKALLRENTIHELSEGQSDDYSEPSLPKNLRNYTANDIVKILKRVAESGKRPKEFLQQIPYVIQQNSYKLSLNEISDILYSVAKLSYRNEPFIKFLTKPITKEVSNASPKTVSSILHSLGTLKYRDCEIIDTLLKSLVNHGLDIKSSVECLMSLSFLNYPCSYADSLAKSLSELNETDYHQTTHYINFVWACVILNQLQYVTDKHVAKVVSEPFLTQLQISGYHPGIVIKLLNIQAVSQLIGQKIGEKRNSPPIFNIPSRYSLQKKTQFFTSVMDTISYILPAAGYFRAAVETGAGFLLDVEYYVNSDNYPVPLNKAPHTKVGILLLEYQETCSDGTPSGIFAFKVKLLEQRGYKIIVLHYADYPIGSLLSTKIDFLREKLSNIDVSATPVKSTQDSK